MVRVAREANVEVIAEGVEQIETAKLLSDLGIRLMQGYLFGRPSDSLGGPVAPLPRPAC
jgi:EAL domain-containing protein (putative c-di-GMP-specific phosphodiesterase class I)